MASKKTCIITTSDEGRGAYGVTTDTDENVYFPVSISEKLNLEEFEEVEVIIVKNDRPEPPWRAIRVRRVDEDNAE